MPEPLDLDALERALHNTQWATHDRCTCIACENGRDLIEELRAARADRDDRGIQLLSQDKLVDLMAARAERAEAAIARVEAWLADADLDGMEGYWIANGVLGALWGDDA